MGGRGLHNLASVTNCAPRSGNSWRPPAWRFPQAQSFSLGGWARLSSQAGFQRGKVSLPFVAPRSSLGLGRCEQSSESPGGQASRRRLPRDEPCGRGSRTETAWGRQTTNKPTNKGCVCYRRRKGPFSSGPWAPRTSSGPGDPAALAFVLGPGFPKATCDPGCSERARGLRPDTSQSESG